MYILRSLINLKLIGVEKMQVKDLFREVKYPIELFDKNGNQIYYEDSCGYWVKKEYDDFCRMIYYKDSIGYYEILEYDENNVRVFVKTPSGIVFDNRPKPNKVITINGIDIELTNEAMTKLKEALES
jgi:hypothetical protein